MVPSPSAAVNQNRNVTAAREGEEKKSKHQKYIKFIFDSILGPGQGSARRYHHISHVTRDTCSRF